MVNQKNGFTLIELVVAMAVVVTLAVQTTQIGKNWIDDSLTKKANLSMQTGVKLARALSLRNKLGSSIGSSFVVTPNAVCVVPGSVTAISCAGSYTWIDSLTATVNIGNSQYGCVAYDNTGIATQTTTCSNAMSYTISRGNKNVQGSI